MYLYAWRPLLVAAIVFPLGILTEFIMERRLKKKVSEAVLVTCALFTLAMPPLVPLWLLPIGIIFAVLMGKEVFGGFGRNIFNPAITGRIFIYISFPNLLGAAWMEPVNFGFDVDTLSSATPLAMLRSGESLDLLPMFFGLRSGSLGEAPIFLIVAAAVYLIATKTANWRVIVSMVVSGFLLSAALYYSGVVQALHPVYGLMSGSFLFVAVFMATDPISAVKKPLSAYLYGTLIGVTAILVRTFSLFPEGTSFGILIGNTFASLIDEYIPRKLKAVKK